MKIAKMSIPADGVGVRYIENNNNKSSNRRSSMV